MMLSQIARYDDAGRTHKILLAMIRFFFFSSRRRHTRFDCDWSSDVCSSDLILIVGLAPGMHGANRTGRPFTGDHAGILLYQTLYQAGLASRALSTSADDGQIGRASGRERV